VPPRGPVEARHGVQQRQRARRVRGPCHLRATPWAGLIARLVDRGPTRQVKAGALAQLTEREREVVGLAAQGMSNDEIAEHLVISPATAKTHVSRAMVKLGARDRAQLVALAYQHRLIDPPDPTLPTLDNR
jgi:DNA-binding NarL/FixJ family response regulator